MSLVLMVFLGLVAWNIWARWSPSARRVLAQERAQREQDRRDREQDRRERQQERVARAEERARREREQAMRRDIEDEVDHMLDSLN